MTGLFEVVFFDPKEHTARIDSYRVVARDAEDAISKARKILIAETKHWMIEAVNLMGWSDE